MTTESLHLQRILSYYLAFTPSDIQNTQITIHGTNKISESKQRATQPYYETYGGIRPQKAHPKFNHPHFTRVRRVIADFERFSRAA